MDVNMIGIGSVPAGAEVEILRYTNGWDLVRYNGKTVYIHGGNLGSSFVVKQVAPAAQSSQNTYKTTQSYFDNNWMQTAQQMNQNYGVWKNVEIGSGYPALRTDTTYDNLNVIGQLYTGDQGQIQGCGS